MECSFELLFLLLLLLFFLTKFNSLFTITCWFCDSITFDSNVFQVFVFLPLHTVMFSSSVFGSNERKCQVLIEASL